MKTDWVVVDGGRTPLTPPALFWTPLPVVASQPSADGQTIAVRLAGVGAGQEHGVRR